MEVGIERDDDHVVVTPKREDFGVKCAGEPYIAYVHRCYLKLREQCHSTSREVLIEQEARCP